MAVITSDIQTGPYVGNGSQTAFAFTFSAISASDVAVYVNDVLVNSALYSVALTTNAGTVTFITAPASAAQVSIRLNPDFLQITEYSGESEYGFSSVNASNRRDSIRQNWLYKKLITVLPSASAVTFPRFNADNTVSVLDAAAFRTAIGASSTTGTVTSVAGAGSVSGLTLSGTFTSAGSLTLGGTLAVLPSNFASQTANTILAAPNGSAGVPTFRAIAIADVPTLNQNTTGTAANVSGTVAVANGGTGGTTQATARSGIAAAASGSNADITALTNAAGIQFGSPTGGALGAGTINATGVYVNGVAVGGGGGGGSGTVTSVGMSVPTFLTVTPASITTVGTFAVTLSGTALPVANGGTGATTLTGVVIGNGTSAFTTVTAPSGAIVGTTDTQTLTNKRVTSRVNAQTTTASPFAWNSDSYDQQSFSALANALTINADAGTPTDGQKAIFRFKDNGTARALTWTTGTSKSFRAIGVTLPTTTVISKTLYVGCVYNGADSRWDAVAVSQEA